MRVLDLARSSQFNVASTREKKVMWIDGTLILRFTTASKAALLDGAALILFCRFTLTSLRKTRRGKIIQPTYTLEALARDSRKCLNCYRINLKELILSSTNDRESSEAVSQKQPIKLPRRHKALLLLAIALKHSIDL